MFGRSHLVISYFGANIYPENVSVGLEQLGIREWVTGKFVMQAREDEGNDRFLEIVIELAPGETASHERRDTAAQVIVRELRRSNSEFANYVPPASQLPRAEPKAHGDPEWFPAGVKHRYARR